MKFQLIPIDNFRATAEGEDEQVTTNGIDGQVYNGIPDWVGENLNSLYQNL